MMGKSVLKSSKTDVVGSHGHLSNAFCDTVTRQEVWFCPGSVRLFIFVSSLIHLKRVIQLGKMEGWMASYTEWHLMPLHSSWWYHQEFASFLLVRSMCVLLVTLHTGNTHAINEDRSTNQATSPNDNVSDGNLETATWGCCNNVVSTCIGHVL